MVIALPLPESKPSSPRTASPWDQLEEIVAAARRRDGRSIDRAMQTLGLSPEEGAIAHLLCLLQHDDLMEIASVPFRRDPGAVDVTCRDLLDVSAASGVRADMRTIGCLEDAALVRVDRSDAFRTERDRRVTVASPLVGCLLSTRSTEHTLGPAAMLLTGDACLPELHSLPRITSELSTLAATLEGEPALLVGVHGDGGAGCLHFVRRLAGMAKRHVLRISAPLLPQRTDDALAAMGGLAAAARFHGWLVLLDGLEAASAPDAIWERSASLLRGLVLVAAPRPDALPQALQGRIADVVSLPSSPPARSDALFAMAGVSTARAGKDWTSDSALPLPPCSAGAGAQALRRASVLSGGAQVRRSDVAEALGRIIASGPDGGAWLEAPRARLEDLVLDRELAAELGAVAAACKVHGTVLDLWGFRSVRPSGHGVSVLLDGPPGTGKTMAAHALANAIDRMVLRVDVPSVLSRWVGESEKALAGLFERAREQDAVLLFDEADSFFAQRSTEVRGANDRYANAEVNTVLQLLEQHSGVVILTTNLANALDPAVRRRLRYRLTFDKPAAPERERLWVRNLPPAAPLGDDVDPRALAEDFELTGAHVANAALRAASVAASEGTSITQRHLTDAAEAECRALGMLCRGPQTPDNRRTRR